MSHTYTQPSDDSLIELATALDRVNASTFKLIEVHGWVPSATLNLKRLDAELSQGVTLIRQEIHEAMAAIQIMVDHRPLASMFPDGTLPPRVLSPRQIVYLAGLAKKTSN